MGKILKMKLSDLTRRGLLSWILAALLEFLLLPVDAKKLAVAANLAQMSILRMIFIFAALIVLFQWLDLKPKRTARGGLPPLRSLRRHFWHSRSHGQASAFAISLHRLMILAFLPKCSTV